MLFGYLISLHTERQALSVVLLGKVEFKDFHQVEKLLKSHTGLIFSNNFPKDETDDLRTVQSIAFFPDVAGGRELFNKPDQLFVSVFVFGGGWQVVEVSEVRVNHFHDDDGVERDIHLESLTILIPEFNESIQRQSLFVPFFGSVHRLVNSLLLLLS